MDNKCNRKLLTSKQVSRQFGLSIRTIQRLSQQGKIKSIKLGGQWRYYKGDIERYLSIGTDFSKKPARVPDNFVDRRAYPRINTNFRCQYSINLPPFKEINNHGIIRDLSAGGIFLTRKDNKIDKIKINDPINLDFVLTSDWDQRINIRTKGKVVRKSPDGVGIRFKNINKEAQSKITEYAS